MMVPLKTLVFVSVLAAAFVACGAADEGGQSTSTGELVYCDVEPILEQYCLRCHGEPLENHAPFGMTSWQALQEDYPAGSGTPIWERMTNAVETDFMPLTQIVLEPPVEPLPAPEKAQLLEWLAAGAPQGGSGPCR